MKANYTVEFITTAQHDAAKVENVSGSFDIGGFNTFSNNDVPAQDFDFQVQVNDYDNDVFSSALSQFSVHIDTLSFRRSGRANLPNPVRPLRSGPRISSAALFFTKLGGNPGFRNC